ncbi:MAG: 2OG-Fe(II) oxygenase [Thermoanaerobaculia bacterium]|nr:2OG-Fe(II) oxygenase [Thermoanaerobaculia bacterium]
MLNLDRIAKAKLESTPFSWAQVGDLFSPGDAEALARTYPRDHFKTLTNRGGEKDYDYDARSLIRYGGDQVAYAEELSDSWRELAGELLSPEYRAAMSALTGVDLSTAPLEVNVCHYGPGASLGPHPDLSDKVVTHILYFNRDWRPTDGGCLQILASCNERDAVAEVLPTVGNSAVLVRSDNSWHAVSRVVGNCSESRKSVTVTFYRPGSDSSMWPLDDTTPLHRYEEARVGANASGSTWMHSLRRLFTGR